MHQSSPNKLSKIKNSIRAPKMLQKTNASLFFAGFEEQKLGGHGRSRIYGAKICETSQIKLVIVTLK